MPVRLCSLAFFSAASIYPGRGGPGESGFYPSRHGDHDGNQALSDDEEIQEDENDWMGDTVCEAPTKSMQKRLSKFSESMATEVSSSSSFIEATVTLLNTTALYLFLETVLGELRALDTSGPTS